MIVKKFAAVLLVLCFLFTALGAPFAQAKGFEQTRVDRLRPLSHSMVEGSNLSAQIENVRTVLARSLLTHPNKFPSFFTQYKRKLKKISHPTADSLEKFLFSYPVREYLTGKQYIFGALQEKYSRPNFVMVFSKEGALEQTAEQDEAIEQLLLNKNFVVEDGWKLKDVRTGIELWTHPLMLPQITQNLLQFKKNRLFLEEDIKVTVLEPQTNTGYLWEWIPFFLPFHFFMEFSFEKLSDRFFSTYRGSARYERCAGWLELTFASLMSIGIFINITISGFTAFTIPLIVTASLLRGFPVAYLFSGAHKGKWNETKEDKFNRVWSLRVVGYVLSQVIAAPAIWYGIYYKTELAPLIGSGAIPLLLGGLASWLIGAVLVVRLQWIYDIAVRKKWLPPFWHIADIAESSNSHLLQKITWKEFDLRRAEQALQDLEAFLAEDLSDDVSDFLFRNIGEIVHSIPAPYSQSFVLTLEKVLRSGKLNNFNSYIGIKSLMWLLMHFPVYINPSIIETIEIILERKNLDSLEYDSIEDLISFIIAKKRPDLIPASFVTAAVEILNTRNLWVNLIEGTKKIEKDNLTYSAACNILETIAKHRPDLITDASIVHSLEKVYSIVGLTSSVYSSAAQAILAIAQIHPTFVTANTLAVLNNFIPLAKKYKLEKFVWRYINKTILGIIKKRPNLFNLAILLTQEKILRENGHEDSVYQSAAELIEMITLKHSLSIQKSTGDALIKSLRRKKYKGTEFVGKDKSKSQYSAALVALITILKLRSDIIDPDILIEAINKFLKNSKRLYYQGFIIVRQIAIKTREVLQANHIKTLESYASRLLKNKAAHSSAFLKPIAECFREITYKRLDLIQLSSVKILIKILKIKDLWPTTYLLVLDAFRVLIRLRPEFNKEIFFALETLVMKKGHESQEYRYAFNLMKQINKRDPSIAKDSQLFKIIKKLPEIVLGHPFHLWRIYENDFFRMWMEEEFSAVEAYSIANAIYDLLEESHLQLSPLNIEKAFELIYTIRFSLTDKNINIYAPDVSAINIFHQHQDYDPKNLEAIQIETGVKPEHISTFKGLDKKEEILKLIAQCKGPTTIYVHAHGDKEGFSLDEKRDSFSNTNSNKKAPFDAPHSINYRELADALLKSGNLENINLILDCCHPYDLSIKLMNYLKEELEINPDKRSGIPLTITTNGRGRFIYTGVFIKGLSSVLKKGQPLTITDILKAEDAVFEYEDPLILFPVYNELFDYIKTKLPRALYFPLMPIASIFYPVRKMGIVISINKKPLKIKYKIQNFLFWLGEPLTVAPRWETFVFPLLGYIAFAWGIGIGDTALANFGLEWATLGFAFAHIIVRWIVRAISYPDIFSLLLKEERRSILEIIILDFRDFVSLLIASSIFLLPYLTFDPFSATVLSIYAHSQYNRLVLSGNLPTWLRWLPVADIFHSTLEKTPELEIESIESIDEELILKAIAAHVKDELEDMKYKHQISEISYLKMEEKESSDLPYPNGANVGLMITGVAGLEAAALLTSKGRLKNTNYLFVNPINGLFFGKNNPNQIFVSSAFYFDNNGRPILARFKTPIPIHALDYSRTEVNDIRKKIETSGVPLLNSFWADSFADDKITFGEFLMENGVPTPQFNVLEGDLSKREVLRVIANLMIGSMASNTSQGAVIKPYNGSTGDGVEMFGFKEFEKAAQHARELLKKGHKVLAQDRIFNFFWKDEETGHPIDWNLRVLTTWNRDKVVIDPEMIEVRFQPYSNKPVNKSKGSKVITLNEFLTYHGISLEERKKFMESIQKTLEPAVLAFEERVAKENPEALKNFKNTGLIGWDIIRAENGTWHIIEANAGRVGGLQTIDSLVLSGFRGNALIPVIKHLSGMAHTYKKLNPNIISDEKGVSLSFWKDPAILSNLAAQFYYDLEDYKTAEKLMRAAISRKPNSSMLHNNLGIYLEEQGQNKKAKKEYAQAVKIDPTNHPAQKNLANCLNNLGEFKRAEKISRKLLKIYPSDIKLWNVLGISLLKQGQLEEAKELFLRVLEKTDPVDSYRATLYFNLGLTYAAMQENIFAEKAFMDSLTHDIKSSEAWENLGIVHCRMKAFEQAVQDFQKSISINPNEINLYLHLGNAYIWSNQWEKAEEVFRQALKIQPKNVEVLNSLAVVLVQQGKTEESNNFLCRAILRNKSNYVLHRNLGHVSMKLGEWLMAEVVYKRLIKGDPKNKYIFEQLGKALIKQNKIRSFRKPLYRSLQISPVVAKILERHRISSAILNQNNENFSFIYVNEKTRRGPRPFIMIERTKSPHLGIIPWIRNLWMEKFPNTSEKAYQFWIAPFITEGILFDLVPVLFASYALLLSIPIKILFSLPYIFQHPKGKREIPTIISALNILSFIFFPIIFGIKSGWDSLFLYLFMAAVHSTVNTLVKRQKETEEVINIGPWQALTPYIQDKVILATKSRFNELKQTNLILAGVFGLTHWRNLVRKPHEEPKGMPLKEEIALVSRGLAKKQNIRMLTNSKVLVSEVEVKEFKRWIENPEERKVQMVVISDIKSQDEERIKTELEMKGIPRSFVKVIYEPINTKGTFSLKNTLINNPWLMEEDYSLWVVKNNFWSDILGKILNARALGNGSELIELDLKSSLVSQTSQ